MYSTLNNHSFKTHFVKLKKKSKKKKNLHPNENVVVMHSDSNTSSLIECYIRK